MHIHVAIVSEQSLPTVIPCLMARPDRVMLVVSRAMANRARRLQAVLREHGIDSEIRGEAPDARLEAIRVYASKLADEVESSAAGGEVIFNATGGNKLMTLGFMEVFRERAARIIYTDTAHAQIEVLHERGTTYPQPVPMMDVLDVPRYLAVQGFQYLRSESDDLDRVARIEQRYALTKTLVRQATSQGGLIRLLNALTRRALDGQGRALSHPVQSLDFPAHGDMKAVLNDCVRAGLLDWDGMRTVRFRDIDAARFLGGGWLEEYAFLTARRAGLCDVRMGVDGVWDGAERARNEFDVLACHRNRMLFIECKTLRFKEDENDNEVAYRVSSLGEDVRGLFGETWVVTAQEPTRVLADRATQAGFRLVGPRVLESLSLWVKLWKEGESAGGRG
jgi:hypothetical protein